MEELEVVNDFLAAEEIPNRDVMGFGIQLDMNGSETMSERRKTARITTATVIIKNSLLNCLMESIHVASVGKETSNKSIEC